jgi:aminoglycoside phosphotransferase (APT) family kinase protein
LDKVKTPKLLNDDLWPRNVIIDGVGEDIYLKAVIDGERAFWGDPISD